jgi:hypothetical protein
MQQVPMFVRYGLAASAVMAVVFFAPSLVFGVRPEWMRIGEIVGYTTMVLAMTATVLAMRAERERRGGRITFGGAFAVGAGVSLVAAALFGVATWLWLVIGGDALPEALMAYYAAQIEGSGLPEAEAAARLQELQDMRWMFYNRPLQGLVMFATVFPIGILESLIGAWFVRR